MGFRPGAKTVLFLVTSMLLGSCAATHVEKKTQVFKVNTDPPGAHVWIEDSSGKKLVGDGPTEVSYEYSVEKTEFNSNWWWSLAGGAAVGGAGGGLVYYEGNIWSGLGATGLTLGILGAAGFLTGMIVGIIGETKEGETALVGPGDVTLGADLEGYTSDSKGLVLPIDDEAFNFVLKSIAAVPYPATETKPAATAAATVAPATSPRRQIVAVFDIQDVAGILAKGEVEQLTMYLGTALTTTGQYKVISRDQLRARLLDQKQSSYKSCVDESCQIELGKAMAAQKSLATQLLKVGKHCAVTANLYDLKTETAERGAMVNTGCTSDQLLDSMRQVAKQLSVN